MGQDAYNDQASEAYVVKHTVRMQGTGATAPSKEFGRGVTITRLGVGNYRLTWSDNPGNFIGFAEPGKQSTAAGALKQCTVDAIAWDATNRRLDIQLWSSAGAARELAAAEWLTLTIAFKRAGLVV